MPPNNCLNCQYAIVDGEYYCTRYPPQVEPHANVPTRYARLVEGDLEIGCGEHKPGVPRTFDIEGD